MKFIFKINGCPALHCHVEHLHVVVHHQDVRHRAPVDILHVRVTSLGQDESVALLLVEDSSEAVRILAPGNISVVVSHVPQYHLLLLQGVSSEGHLIMTREEVTIASPASYQIN